MKLLITFLSYSENTFGGVEKSIYSLCKGLINNNTEIIIYTNSATDARSNSNITIYKSRYLITSFDKSNMNKSIYNNYKKYENEIVEEIIKIEKNEKPDYILVIDHIWGIIPSVDILSRLNSPIGLVMHMMHDLDKVKEVLSQGYSHIFSISPYILNELKKIKSDIKYYLLPNTISSDFFDNKRTLCKTRIMCNARMADGKGVDVLIKAFEEVLNLYPNCELYLCNGDFHFKTKLDFSDLIENINAKYHEPKITCYEKIPWDEMSFYLHKMDLVVLPTSMETFGIGALETIASGIPLITTKFGNLPYLLEDAAFYLEEITKEHIVESIVYVFNNDSEVMRKAKRGRNIAKQYIDNNVAKKFLDIIEVS